MEFFSRKVKFGRRTLTAFRDTYVSNGNTYVGLLTADGEQFCDVTVNLRQLPSGLAAIDTNNLPKGLAKKLVEVGLIVEKKGFSVQMHPSGLPCHGLITNGFAETPMTGPRPEVCACYLPRGFCSYPVCGIADAGWNGQVTKSRGRQK